MNKNIKLLSLFSGIGAFEKALHNIGVNYELVNYCEIDKFASKSYSLIHNVDESKNLIDVTKVDTSKLPDDIDLVTYGFPCQDISSAGKQKGFTDESGNRTRSGLFFEALRIIEQTKPKVAIAENVKALTSKRFTKEFKTVLKSLDEAGYNCYWKVLNAKNYGVPQNRERVFIISIRKDIDNFKFRFPTPKELDKKLKDVLERDVDELFYFDKDDIEKIKSTNFKKDFYKNITFKLANGIYDNFAIMDYRFDEGLRVRKNNLCPTLMTKKPTSLSSVPIVYIDRKLRFLTPNECFRLMGFDDSDCDILKDNGISSTQIYKQAGNSIVVNVLEALFKELFKVI